MSELVYMYVYVPVFVCLLWPKINCIEINEICAMNVRDLLPEGGVPLFKFSKYLK